MESWKVSDCIYVKVATNWQCKYNSINNVKNMIRMKFSEIIGERIYNLLIISISIEWIEIY